MATAVPSTAKQILSTNCSKFLCKAKRSVSFQCKAPAPSSLNQGVDLSRNSRTQFSFAIGSSSTSSFSRVDSLRCFASATEAEAPVEKFEYQAEVSRLLDLIVHSLYSNKEVFLRELVSNASDALDKVRFLSVTEPELMDATQELSIRIKVDRDAGTITIEDTGIGMTREELVGTLGTIAESGTAKFVQAIKEKNEKGAPTDSNLIGQFGVGFYSAFLVAQKVRVTTKSPRSDKQFVWEAEAEASNYTISEETDPSALRARGTSITLFVKDDEKTEYCSASRISSLVNNYSQFISFPIYTWEELSRENEEEYEEPGKEGEEPVKKTRKVTEKYNDWKLANETKPLWVRSPKEVSKAEYHEFFKNTFKEFIDPMAYTHFSTEGEIEFQSLLFIPGMPPFDENFLAKQKNIRLHVKRVFISDEFDYDLFPRYLNFVKGVVDSNDLPLNVSREILQESRIVRIMKKRLVRKTFDMLDDLAKSEDKEAYENFWKSFGKNLKYGCLEDSTSQTRIVPLLRFFSSKSEDKLTSIPEYVERMAEGQKSIFFLAADNIGSAKSAPFLERLDKKGYEVLFLLDSIDEPCVNALKKYKDFDIVDITKDELNLGEDDTKVEEKSEGDNSALCDWIKLQLGDKISKVQVSKRLESSPCVLVASKFGLSANMEKLMKAQMGNSEQIEFQRGQRILEVNTSHPIIQDLSTQSKDNPNSVKAKKLVELLYDTSLLASGFTPDNPAIFGTRVYELMAVALAKGEEKKAEEVNQEEVVVEGVEASVAVDASEIRVEADPWKQ